MKIKNIEELKERIAEYSVMFPETAASLEDVNEFLENEHSEHGGNVGLFGMSVSPEWEDKCYSFEYRPDGSEPAYEFMGMYKC